MTRVTRRFGERHLRSLPYLALIGSAAMVVAAGRMALPIVISVVVLTVIVVAVTVMTVLAMTSGRRTARRRSPCAGPDPSAVRLEAAMRQNFGLHAQLLTQAREAGMLDERQRLAGEIHDVLAQGLAGIVTQLEAAERAGDSSCHLHTARSLARDSLREARRSVRALGPETLDATDLPGALTVVAGGWSRLHRVTVDVLTTGTPRPLTPEAEHALLRTVQEALSNVARHAAASRVVVTLSYMDDLVSLDIRDDGTGFDPGRESTAGPDNGFGLVMMRRRVQRVAGLLQVESEPGGGTAIRAVVPAGLTRCAGGSPSVIPAAGRG